MKKKDLVKPKNNVLKGLLWGFGVNVFGIMLSLLIMNLVIGLLAVIYGTPFYSPDMSTKQLTPDFVKSVVTLAQFNTIMYVGVYAYIAFVFGLSGWIVLRIAKGRGWYLASIPAITVILITTVNTFFTGGGWSQTNFLYMLEVIKIQNFLNSPAEIADYYYIFGYAFYILMAILGGLIAKHISLKIKE